MDDYCTPEVCRLSAAAAFASASPVLGALALAALTPASGRRDDHRADAVPAPVGALFRTAVQHGRAAKTSAELRLAGVRRSLVGSGRWFKAVAVLTAVACLLHTYHVPLPPGAVNQRWKLSAVDWAMRSFYKYPARLLHKFSVKLSLLYTRHSLSVLMRLVNVLAKIFLPHMGARLSVHDILLDGVPSRVYVPPAGDWALNASVVFIHGGGFAIGDVLDYDYVVRSLAERLRLPVVSVDYRLSPEHPYPSGLDDCERAVAHWLRRTAVDRFAVANRSIVLVGDSAGGNLVSVTTQRLASRHRLEDVVKGQILVYPLLQFADFRLPSYQTYYNEYRRTAFLDPYSVARMFILYAGHMPTDDMVDAVLGNEHTGTLLSDAHWRPLAHHRLPYQLDMHYYEGEHRPPGRREVHSLLGAHLTNPEVSPLMAGREHISQRTPPTAVLTAQYDILRDEGHLYAELLRSHNVSVTELHYEGGFHGMLNFHTELDVGHRAMNDIASLALDFLRR